MNNQKKLQELHRLYDERLLFEIKAFCYKNNIISVPNYINKRGTIDKETLTNLVRQDLKMYDKALSIKNPWAWLIARGLKDIENRTWKTNYRGKILIHVSKKWDTGFRDMSNMFTFEQWKTLNSYHQRQLINQFNMPTGCIIGEVEIIDCIQDSKSIWALDNHYHWVLDNPVFYENYIPNVKGKLSIWNYEPSLSLVA